MKFDRRMRVLIDYYYLVPAICGTIHVGNIMIILYLLLPISDHWFHTNYKCGAYEKRKDRIYLKCRLWRLSMEIMNLSVERSHTVEYDHRIDCLKTIAYRRYLSLSMSKNIMKSKKKFKFFSVVSAGISRRVDLNNYSFAHSRRA